jgi:hypothetical protein
MDSFDQLESVGRQLRGEFGLSQALKLREPCRIDGTRGRPDALVSRMPWSDRAVPSEESDNDDQYD